MDGCLHIAQGLIYASQLKTLNLSGNRIGTKGLTIIMEALKDHTKIESLYLDSNMIDNDGAYAISKLLAN